MAEYIVMLCHDRVEDYRVFCTEEQYSAAFALMKMRGGMDDILFAVYKRDGESYEIIWTNPRLKRAEQFPDRMPHKDMRSAFIKIDDVYDVWPPILLFNDVGGEVHCKWE